MALTGSENKKIKQNVITEIIISKFLFIPYLLFPEFALTYLDENIKRAGSTKRSGNNLLIHDI
ncbi:MAG: hypothetical protein PVG39_12255, partial [Desulfobacteraceae bacterium]